MTQNSYSSLDEATREALALIEKESAIELLYVFFKQKKLTLRVYSRNKNRAITSTCQGYL